jgi:hypothetical protein
MRFIRRLWHRAFGHGALPAYQMIPDEIETLSFVCIGCCAKVKVLDV